MAPLARVTADAGRLIFQLVEGHPTLGERVHAWRATVARRLPAGRRLFELTLITIVVAAALVWVWVLRTQPMNRR
jgi:hypothetical protein